MLPPSLRTPKGAGWRASLRTMIATLARVAVPDYEADTPPGVFVTARTPANLIVRLQQALAASDGRTVCYVCTTRATPVDDSPAAP